MITSTKKYIAPLIVASLLVLVGVKLVYAFDVGIEMSDAKPVVLVDDTGFSFNGLNPMPVSASVTPTPITTVSDGDQDVATAGTAVAIAGVATPCVRATVQAKEGNTDVIAIGGSTVVAALGTRTGTALVPLMAFTCEGCDLADYYIDSVINGDGVTYTCEN